MGANQEILDVMNSVYKADPKAIRELMETRVPCNDRLADHPTVAVSREKKVGILGILNGITWKNGERFEAMYDENDELVGFRLMPLEK